MFPIFQHELFYWLRRPHIYLFAGLLFGLALLTMWGMASEAEGGPQAQILNSSYRLFMMSGYFFNLVLFILPATFGAAIYRDYKSGMYRLLYAYPISKRAYLGGKFLAVLPVATVIVLAIGAGFAVGAMLPGVQVDAVQPFALSDYLQLSGVLLVPNLLLFGALTFAIVVRTRNIYVTFISMILVIVFQGIVRGILSGDTLYYWAALLDPSGDTAVNYLVRFWTSADRNSLALPIEGVLLANRLLWFTVAAVLLADTYRRFDFQAFADNRRGKSEPRTLTTPIATSLNDPRARARLRFSVSQRLQTLIGIGWADFRYIVFSKSFAAILCAGFLAVYFQQHEMNPMYGFEILPTTGRMLRVPLFIFGMVINLLTFLYVGVLQFRGRNSGMGALIDIVPQPSWVLLGARLFAVIGMQTLLLSLVMVAGIIAQVLQGYHRFEIGHYLFELLGLQLVHFVIWAMAAFLVHTLIKNMYVGFLLLLLLPTAVGGLSDLGAYFDWPFLQASILQFNQVPGIGLGFAYSDLDGYGSVLPLYFLFKTYWLLLGIILLVFSLLWWRRGAVFNIKERLALVQKRLVGPVRVALLLLVPTFLFLGGYLYAKENFWAPTHFDQDRRTAIAVQNEHLYLRFRNAPQPRLARAEVQMDIYPERRDFRAAGRLYFVNKIQQPLDTILVATSFRERTTYTLNRGHTVVSRDSLVQFDIYQLEEPLRFGDTLTMDFTVRNHPNAFLLDNSAVRGNGTYLDADLLPRLGFREILLGPAKKRQAQGLPLRSKDLYLPTDSTLLGYAFAQNNMDRIEYETIVSTSAEQEVFSMGKLVRSWRAGERRYAHYRSEGPIVNNISWLSGSYAERTAEVGPQTLKMYHHPAHDHNAEQMIGGLRASIKYCSEWFGPLTYDTLRLIEFPITEGTHATLNGNLIPYSEALFLAKADPADSTAFHLPFYTSAHEAAHYWWGHRVDPANVKGGKLVTEALAEYLAMQVLEERYGSANLLAFRKKMHNIYLRERARRSDEQPLITAGLEQEYLNYRKGGLAFYALSTYWGESALNTALAEFESRRRHAPPPYPTSLELVDHLRQAMPDSLRYLIEDYFETITLYDHQITNTETTPNGEHGYQVTVSFDLRKYRADATGQRILPTDRTESLPLQDYVQLGFYRDTPAGEQLLALRTVKVEEVQNVLTVQLSESPDRVVLDPQWLLFEEDRE